MNKYQSLLATLLLMLTIRCSVAQTTYTPPAIPARYEKELQQAIQAAQTGQIHVAETQLQSLIEKFPLWTSPRQQLSRLNYEIGRKDESILLLEASLAIDTLSQLTELYSLGRIYEEVSQPIRAYKCYAAVIRWAHQQQSLLKRATTSLQALEAKSHLWGFDPLTLLPLNTYSIDLQPLDAAINTTNHESLGRWTLDGQTIIFTRLLHQQEDIFFTSFDSSARQWMIEDFSFNTPQNEGAHAISPNGKNLIFTSCNRQDGLGSCDLYLSVMREGLWTEPVNMGPAFNSLAWDGQPCFGLDGLSLFFSSSRPGGMGGRDIWYAYQQAAGKWSEPINAGPMINTPDNEESPFVHFDGQTLYFMRDGKEGLGGYDLYVSRKGVDGQWLPAENLGAPINSAAHEGALSLHPNGTTAMITRETADNRNDLFSFELPEKFAASRLQALHVTLLDQETLKPVRARLEIFQTDQKDTIRFSQWADGEGTLSASLQQLTRYGILAVADGYLMHSSHLEADSAALRVLEIHMIPYTAAGEKVVALQNIFFETGSAVLLPASDPELQRLWTTLRSQPTMRIEIRGHTDDIGDEASNQLLSEARARAVYDFLTGRGIPADRLTYVGFGESQPLADNSTPEGRRQNRRTEFRVLTP